MGQSIGGKGGPAPPDFTRMAELQARSERPDQTTPWATNRWTQGPGGQWSQNISLTGDLGQASDALTGQIAAGAGAPAMTGDQAREQAISAAYGQAASRLDPMWAQREEAQRVQLANQGLDPGSQAADAAAANLSRERADAYSSALNNAIGQGTQAQALTFGQNQAARMQPYEQLGLLRSLTQMPGVQGGTNYLQAANMGYQGDLQKYGIGQAGKNSALGGAAMLGAGAFAPGAAPALSPTFI